MTHEWGHKCSRDEEVQQSGHEEAVKRAVCTNKSKVRRDGRHGAKIQAQMSGFHDATGMLRGRMLPRLNSERAGQMLPLEVENSYF